MRTLSGGERNRLLLARLFALPANVLVLDEPTNDLDIDTLELLEELLQAYAGTVFLVSHDRALPRQRRHQHDRLGRRSRRRGSGANTKAATRTGSCSASAARSALRPRRGARRAGAPRAATQRASQRAAGRQPRASRSKLSYKEQRELDALPARIEALEPEQKELAALLGQRRVLRRRSGPRRAGADALAQIDDELIAALERWEVLAR